MLRRPAERRTLATVLFTDIVTSTETAARLGDRRWRELLHKHHAAVRRALRTHRGREIDTAGDGFLIAFQQPGAAVECAVAAREAVAALGLRMRAGIHTGEVEPMGTKVGGMAVHLAARVLASCEPGQIRVTSTVRDLVTGSGLEFTDAGTHQLKGVPGKWHLFALAIEAPTPAPMSEEAQLRHGPSTSPRAVWLAAAGLALAGSLAAATILLRPAPGASAAAAANTVIRVDPQGSTVVESISIARGPSLLATDGSDLWVASETARTLTHLSIGSGDERSVGLDGVPTGLAVGGGMVYVAQAFEHSIERIGVETDVAAASLEGTIVRRIVFDGDDGWGIDPVADAVIHLSPGREPELIELPEGSGAADLALDAEAVWIANATGRTVTRIDRETREAATISLVDEPTAVATSDAVVWVVSETGDSLARIDPGTNRVVATTDVCDAPVDLVASGTEVWVACAGSRELRHLGADGNLIGRLMVAATPSAVLVVNGSVWLALRAD